LASGRAAAYTEPEIPGAANPEAMQYMIVETFVHGPEPVYRRFHEHGRLVIDAAGRFAPS
jgi:hypothetical protein